MVSSPKRPDKCALDADCASTAVYSHRILQGKWEVDQFHLALIIECQSLLSLCRPRVRFTS